MKINKYCIYSPKYNAFQYGNLHLLRSNITNIYLYRYYDTENEAKKNLNMVREWLQAGYTLKISDDRCSKTEIIKVADLEVREFSLTFCLKDKT